MRKLPYSQIDHDEAFSAGWNKAASIGYVSSNQTTPKTKYKGKQYESFMEGYNASQDNLLLEKAKSRTSQP